MTNTYASCLTIGLMTLCTSVGCSSGPSSNSNSSTSDGLPDLIIASVIADVNADGQNDVIVSNGQSVDQDISPRVYINEGNGSSFQLKANAIPAQYGREKASAVDMKVEDMNGDGKQDLLMITLAEDYQSSRVQLFLGQGDGTFRDYSNQISNSRWPSEQTGLLCAQKVGANNAGAFYLRVGDYDGDHHLDFALSFGGISSCGGVIYLNDGSGNFSQASINIQEPAVHPETSLVAQGDSEKLFSTEILDGDLNGDGKIDFFAPRMDSTQVSYINTSSSGSLSFQVVKSTFSYQSGDLGSGILHGALLDMNRDGVLDLIGSQAYRGPDYQTKVAVRAYFGAVHSGSGKGDGTFTLNNDLLSEVPQVHLVRKFLVGDVNGDGGDDLFILNEGIDLAPFPGEPSFLFLSNGLLSLSGKLINSTSTHFTAEAANTHQGALGDLDGDGDLDLLMNNSHQSVVSAPRVARIWLNDGQGHFSEHSPSFHR